jgi:protein-arginine kinase activator protein McsA
MDKNIKDKITQLEEEKAKEIKNQNYTRAAQIRDQIQALQEELESESKKN